MTRFGSGFIGGLSTPGNDAFTKILLHMDGSNGGTTFTDENAGGSAHTWTPTNATTSTVSPKFGASALLTAAGYITTPDHADFTLGSADWTVDFWINANGSTGVVGLFGQGDSVAAANATPIFGSRNASNKLVCQASSGSGFFSCTSATSFNDSTLRHVEFVRVGAVLRLFVNGVQEGGDTAFAFSCPDSSNNWSVGRIGENTTFPASSVYFDEFRLSVGVARHTSNFTPPAAPYI